MAKETLTHDILTAAIEGFEAQKRKIDAQISELRQRLGGAVPKSAEPGSPGKGRRKMSAAGRKSIAEAQRRRWAAAREASPEGKPKVKRKLTAAGRRRISEASKRRWAAAKAAAAPSE
jgi:hypothetical protein